MRSFLVFLLAVVTFALTLSNSAYADREQKFDAGVEQYSRLYGDLATQDSVKQLLVEGDVDAYFDELVRRVPDEDKVFYDYFVLANLLFEEERERSYAYMKKAEELQPDNPYVLYERGIHEHRRSNCVDAARYYRAFHSTDVGRDNPVSWAYLTHCALQLGNTDEAVSAWSNSDFSSYHTSIEKGMYVVFSNNKPNKARQALITRIEAGEHQILCDLIEFDANWEIDWWNSVSKESYVLFDHDLANRVLKTGSRDAKIFDFCNTAADMTDDEFVAGLFELKIWGDFNMLPQSSVLVYEIARRMSANGLASPEQLLEAFGSQLEKVIAENSRDRKFVDVLGFLYSATDNAAGLHEIDGYGWHELNIEKFAGSYLLGVDPKGDDYDRLLEQALDDFPDSTLLNKLRMAKVAAGSERDNAMARYVASEFANVRNNWSGPYRLNDYVASLAHELNQATK
jgi:hypothetical protein